MSEQVDASQSPSGLELAALATAAVPGLQILGVKDVADWDTGSCVAVVDSEGDDWQVYCPTHRMSAAALDTHVRTLGMLASCYQKAALPFAVPEPRGIVTRKNGDLVFVFRHLGGEVGTVEMFHGAPLLANSLGTALGALHELDVSASRNTARTKQSIADSRTEMTALIAEHATAIPSSLRARWVAALREDTLWLHDVALIHGSLCPQSLQVTEGGAVVGIRGFERARFADPALDVAWILYHADDDFLRVFEASYARARVNPDLHILTRAQLIAELETLRWYDSAVRANDAGWKTAGVEALRQMAEELDGDQLVAAKPEVMEIHFTADQEPLLKVNPRLRPSSSTEATRSHEGPLPY